MDTNTSESWLIVRDGDRFSLRYFFNPDMSEHLVCRGGMQFWMRFFCLDDADAIQKLFKHNKDIYNLSTAPTDEIDDVFYEGKIILKSWPAQFKAKGAANLALYDEDVSHQNNMTWSDVLEKTGNPATLYVFDGQWNIMLKTDQQYERCTKVGLSWWAAAQYALMCFDDEDYTDVPPEEIVKEASNDILLYDFAPRPNEDQLTQALVNLLSLPEDVVRLGCLADNCHELLQFARLLPQVHSLQSKMSLNEEVSSAQVHKSTRQSKI